MKYRSDIDGLRAIAIIAVFLFHLGFSFMRGGFIGVDVFFVISGFLITTIIYRDINNKSFSFRDFYERRLRRIFPPLIFMVFGTMILMFIIQPWPDWQMNFWKSVQSVFLFIPNFFFRTELANYWAANSNTMPMLHIWSLGVEEQFYFIFPPLMLLIYTFFKRWIKHIIIILILVSFISMMFASQNHAFYLPWFRAWELLFGSLVAIHMLSKPESQSPRLDKVLNTLGIFGILFGLFLLDDKSFPNPKMLIPIIGTVLVIYSRGAGIVGKLLSMRPMVHIGKLSYSMYLWHWPLIVSARWLLIDLTIPVCIIIFSLSYFLSLFSYKFIEQPFRKKQILKTRKSLFIAAGIIIAFFICAAKPMISFTKKIYPSIRPYKQILKEDYSEFNKKRQMITFGDTSQKDYKLVILGNSHALLSSLMYQRLCNENKVKCAIFWSHSTNVFSQDFDLPVMKPLVDFLAQNKVENALLISSWIPFDINEVDKYLTHVSKEFQKSNKNIRMWTQLPTPRFKYSVPEQVFMKQYPFVSRKEFYTQKNLGKIINILKSRTDYGIIDNLAYLCDESGCFGSKDGIAIYGDTNHFSEYGAELFSPEALKIFK